MSEPEFIQAIHQHRERFDDAWERTKKAITLEIKNRYIRDVTLQDFNFVGIEIIASLFERCHFYNCGMPGLMVGSTFINSTFHDCDFYKREIHYSNCVNSNFGGSDFRKAELTDSGFLHCSFTDVDLRRAYITRCDLRFSSFSGVLLENTMFINTQFYTNEEFRVPAVDRVVAKDISTAIHGSEKRGPEALSDIFIFED